MAISLRAVLGAAGAAGAAPGKRRRTAASGGASWGEGGGSASGRRVAGGICPQVLPCFTVLEAFFCREQPFEGFCILQRKKSSLSKVVLPPVRVGRSLERGWQVEWRLRKLWRKREREREANLVVENQMSTWVQRWKHGRW